MVATWWRALAAVTVACAAAGPAGAGEPLRVDVAGKLDRRGIAELGQARVGPVVFHQALVQNIPPDDEIHDASPTSKARPLPVLVVDNLGRSNAQLEILVTLEDEAGVPLLRCYLSRSKAEGWKDVVSKICRGETMPTKDWPRVKSVHVVGTVAGGE